MASKFSPPETKSIQALELDPKNPRIPVERQTLSSDELVAYVADTYDSIAIAKSIADHDYFPSEPLIAIPKPNSTHLIVVEGNRRLAALKLMRDESLRGGLEDRADWDALDTSNVPDKVPVIVAKSRKDVAPIIGYRHISGIQHWDAYARARYIALRLEEGESFENTATEVGEKPVDLRATYRNYQISKQARPLVSPDVFEDFQQRFGVFTRAMQSADLRDFIGAPPAAKVSVSKNPLPSSKKNALKEFTEYLFGEDAVVSDSRGLTKLGKVLASPDGLKVLRQDRNLEEAHIASGGIRDRLIGRLSNAARSLRAARDDISSYRKDKEVIALADECEEALEELMNLMKSSKK